MIGNDTFDIAPNVFDKYEGLALFIMEVPNFAESPNEDIYTLEFGQIVPPLKCPVFNPMGHRSA